MKVIWHGTAAIEIENGSGGRLLFDPFVPFSGGDVDVNISEFDGFSDILITHGHFDHIMNLPEIVSRNPEVLIHCTQTPYQTLRAKGVPDSNLRMIRYGDELSIQGFDIRVFHSKHAKLPVGITEALRILTSGNLGNLPTILREIRNCRENHETVLFDVRADQHDVTVMGSLNLLDNEKYFTDTDLLILPYNGWEDNYRAAVRIMDRLAPKRVLLDHYDNSFPPLTMPVDLDPFLERYHDIADAMIPRKVETV